MAHLRGSLTHAFGHHRRVKDARIDQIEQIDDQSIRPKPKVKSGDVANYDTRMISAKKTPEESRYPIHYLVWHNKHRQLEKELETSKQVRQRRAPMGGESVLFFIFFIPGGCHGCVSLQMMWIMVPDAWRFPSINNLDNDTAVQSDWTHLFIH